MVTHYRMSRSLSGPWLAPPNDTFDGRAFYAAKTASDGTRRFVFGWDPTRTGETDTGAWNWGGHLVVHEVFQQPDGTLTVAPPPEVTRQFSAANTITPEARIGAWDNEDGLFKAEAADSFAWCSLGAMPSTCQLMLTVSASPTTRSCGLTLRTDSSLDAGYLLRLEPGRQRISFERFPRPGDEPPIIERPLEQDGRPVRLRVLAEGSVIVVYANDMVALSTRGYEHEAGEFGVFVSEGAATFSEVTLGTAGA
jgi:beta-fructofuranosidase